MALARYNVSAFIVALSLTALSASAFTVPTVSTATTSHRLAFGIINNNNKRMIPKIKMAFMEETVLERPAEMTTAENELSLKSTAVAMSQDATITTSNAVTSQPQPQTEEKEMSETQKLMAKVKDAGTAGIISYALWELGFWAISVPVCVFGYYEVTGHWPDLSNAEDQAKLGAEAFAFVNFARFAVPLRIGLALSTTPWIQANVVDRILKKNYDDGKNMTADGKPVKVRGDEFNKSNGGAEHT